jgi:hypothetical protein
MRRRHRRTRSRQSHRRIARELIITRNPLGAETFTPTAHALEAAPEVTSVAKNTEGGSMAALYHDFAVFSRLARNDLGDRQRNRL